MKNLLMLVCLSLFSTATITAENDIPLIVQQSFSSMYPSIKSPYWEKGGESVVAIFTDNEGFKKAFYEENGKRIETQHRLELLELPELVRLFVLENYGSTEITFSGKVTSLQRGWYHVESEYIDRIILKDLDAQGVLINQEEIKFNFQNKIPHRIPNMAPKLLPIRLIFPVQ